MGDNKRSAAHNIDEEIDRIAMPGTLNAEDVFELVVDGFNTGAAVTMPGRQVVLSGDMFFRTLVINSTSIVRN